MDRRGGEEGKAAGEGEGTVTAEEHSLWLRRSLTISRRSRAEANARAKCHTRKDKQYLVGYGSSASTIGANRAGAAAAKELMTFFGEEKR